MINLKTLDNYAGDFDGLSKEQADELESMYLVSDFAKKYFHETATPPYVFI